MNHTTIKITSEFKNVLVTLPEMHMPRVTYPRRPAQRLAAGHGDGYPIAAATAAAIARSPVHIQRPSIGRQV